MGSQRSQDLRAFRVPLPQEKSGDLGWGCRVFNKGEGGDLVTGASLFLFSLSFFSFLNCQCCIRVERRCPRSAPAAQFRDQSREDATLQAQGRAETHVAGGSLDNSGFRARFSKRRTDSPEAETAGGSKPRRELRAHGREEAASAGGVGSRGPGPGTGGEKVD